MKIKPKYQLRWHGYYFSYHDIRTGRKCGEWDIYKITKKNVSALPKEFRYQISNETRRRKQKYGRSLPVIKQAVINAGIMCGFKVDDDGQFVHWSIRRKKRNQNISAVSFGIFHCRWRQKNSTNKKMKIRIATLKESKGKLRFVIDSNFRNSIWPIEKRPFD